MVEKCLIVGLGQIGMECDLYLDSKKFICSHARAFSLHPDFDLIGGVDPDSKRRALFQQFYSKPAYEDIIEALEDLSPKVVIVACPTTEHLKVVKLILEYSKPSVILCEKPLAYKLEDAHSITRLCEDQGVKLFVNYKRQSYPGIIEVKKRFERSKIKEPVRGVVWYTKGFIHNGSHFFNLLEFWLGDFVSSKIVDKGRPWGKFDSEPILHLQFSKGIVLFMPAWDESFSLCTVELVSQNGRLYYDHNGEKLLWYPVKNNDSAKTHTCLVEKPEIINTEKNYSQWHVASQLNHALHSMPAFICTGAQALETLEMMHRIIKS